jgi:hypothetical protein
MPASFCGLVAILLLVGIHSSDGARFKGFIDQTRFIPSTISVSGLPDWTWNNEFGKTYDSASGDASVTCQKYNNGHQDWSKSG